MSERGLVVHQGSLQTIEDRLRAATTDITERIDRLLTDVDRLTPGWVPGSDSHDANILHQQRIRDGVEALGAALDRIAGAVGDYREKAHDAERDNVALI